MKQKTRILIVDDEEGMRRSLEVVLKDERYTPVSACSAVEALKLLERLSVDVVIMDIKMPGLSGTEALKRMKSTNKDLPVIMITGYGSIKGAVQCIKEGAFDYITKPFDTDEISRVVRNAVKVRKLTNENRYLREKLRPKYNFDNIIGQSKSMAGVYEIINKVIDNDVTVLILGESGTGKELVTRAIHFNSLRKNKPFISVSCAALPESLLESELFGYEKGAFTGAVSQKAGKFELAEGGTLFLDEIGDMTLSTQAKMLRVLQERKFERVGGTKTLKVDIRIIAATNKDLVEAIKKKEFREDLYYRLNVVSLSLPPLRERVEDIPLLVKHFIEIFNRTHHKKVKGVSSEAMEILLKHQWPGNARELENIIEQAVILGENEVISPQDLLIKTPADLEESRMYSLESTSLKEAIEKTVSTSEKKIILDALEKTGWNYTKTAALLGISNKTLYNKMKKYALRKIGTQK